MRRRNALTALREKRAKDTSFWFWAVLFIGILFVFDLVFVRIFLIYNVTSNACIEQIVNFGAGEGYPSFVKVAYFTACSILIFWLAFGLIHLRKARKTHILLWGILLAASLLQVRSTHLLQSESYYIPDGSLEVETLAKVTDETGAATYYPIRQLRIRPTYRTENEGASRWLMEKDLNEYSLSEDAWYGYEQTLQGCVWLESGEVSSKTIVFSKAEWEYYSSTGYYGGYTIDPDFYLTQGEVYREAVFGARGYNLENMITYYERRPLFASERERFFQKQECLKRVVTGEIKETQCEWRLNAYASYDYSTQANP